MSSGTSTNEKSVQPIATAGPKVFPDGGGEDSVNVTLDLMASKTNLNTTGGCRPSEVPPRASAFLVRVTLQNDHNWDVKAPLSLLGPMEMALRYDDAWHQVATPISFNSTIGPAGVPECLRGDLGTWDAHTFTGQLTTPNETPTLPAHKSASASVVIMARPSSMVTAVGLAKWAGYDKWGPPFLEVPVKFDQPAASDPLIPSDFQGSWKGTVNVTLQGNDPFIWADYAPIIDNCDARGCHVAGSYTMLFGQSKGLTSPLDSATYSFQTSELVTTSKGTSGDCVGVTYSTKLSLNSARTELKWSTNPIDTGASPAGCQGSLSGTLTRQGG